MPAGSYRALSKILDKNVNFQAHEVSAEILHLKSRSYSIKFVIMQVNFQADGVSAEYLHVLVQI